MLSKTLLNGITNTYSNSAKATLGGEVLYPPSDEDGSMVEPDNNGKYPPAPSLHEVLKVGESLFYVYDFGDSWEHEIYCEALMVKPCCI